MAVEEVPGWAQQLIERFTGLEERLENVEMRSPISRRTSPISSEQGDIMLQPETPHGRFELGPRHDRRRSRILDIGEENKIDDGTDLPAVVNTALVINSVKIEHKLEKLSLRGVNWLLSKEYPAFKAINMDQTKRLVHLIDHTVLEQLVEDQSEKATALSLDLSIATIYQKSDAVIKRILADKLRCNDKFEYAELILDNMTKMRIPGESSGFRFDRTQGYHKYVHPQVCKKLDELEAFDEFLRLGATAEELKKLPAMNWGSEKSWGVFRIFIQAFNPYEDNFVNMLSESKLKSFTDVDDFFKHFRNVSSARAAESRRLMSLDKAGGTPVKLSDIQSKIDYTQARKNREYRRDTEKKAVDSPVALARSATLNQLQQSHFDQFEDDEEVPSVKSTLSPSQQFTEVETTTDVFQLSSGRAFPVGNSAPKAATDVPPPCWMKAFSPERKCNIQGCKFSHDDAVLSQFVRKRLNEVLVSPYLDRKQLTERYSEMMKSSGTLRELVGVATTGDDLEQSQIVSHDT
jgi:hypothetical protein